MSNKDKPPQCSDDSAGVREESQRGTAAKPDDAASRFGIRLFGPLEVCLDGRPLPRLRSRRGLWLLALLTLRAGRPVDRDWLAGTLWPDSDEAQARRSLRQSLHDLRLALGPAAGRLSGDGPGTLRLDLCDAFVDVLAFDTVLASGDPASLEAAIGLYRGPLLEGCSEAWAFAERQAREQAYLAARREYEGALALARREGDRRQIAAALQWLADAAFHDGDPDAAWDLLGEARQLFEELGDSIGLASTLQWLVRIAFSRGDRDTARPLVEELLAICRKLVRSESLHPPPDGRRHRERDGDDYDGALSSPTDLLIHGLGGMGHLERDEGNYDQARALYQESLALRREVGNQVALAQSLEDFAVLAARERHVERAIRLLGAAEAFCETLGARPPVGVIAEYERTVAEGRAALGEAGFAAAWAEGRAMGLPQAVEYALQPEGAAAGE